MGHRGQVDDEITGLQQRPVVGLGQEAGQAHVGRHRRQLGQARRFRPSRDMEGDRQVGERGRGREQFREWLVGCIGADEHDVPPRPQVLRRHVGYVRQVVIEHERAPAVVLLDDVGQRRIGHDRQVGVAQQPVGHALDEGAAVHVRHDRIVVAIDDDPVAEERAQQRHEQRAHRGRVLHHHDPRAFAPQQGERTCHQDQVAPRLGALRGQHEATDAHRLGQRLEAPVKEPRQGQPLFWRRYGAGRTGTGDRGDGGRHRELRDAPVAPAPLKKPTFCRLSRWGL